MAEGVRLTLAFLLAGSLALLTVPLARLAALRLGLLDRPVDYKRHPIATPYLGGLGVIAAFVAAASVLGAGWSEAPAVLAIALLLLLVGTLDDRRALSPALRFSVQLSAGLALWLAGVRWELLGVGVLDLAITLLWVAGLANAFNLLDNIDGAAATTTAVSAAGIAAIAAFNGAPEIAAVALALSGACAAFLVYNLARPAKVFLGDGGSMPLGFLIAALAMLLPLPASGIGADALLIAVPLAGVAIFDTSLVVLSRSRRGLHVFSGARDHSTHRLLAPLGTPRRVCALLAAAQGALCGIALFMHQAPGPMIELVALGYVLMGVVVLVCFEHPRLHPRPSAPARALEQSA